MIPFTKVSGIAAPMPAPNIDTDIIMPKQFLKRIDREGLAIGAFHDLRFDETGAERPEFVLNKIPYRSAKFLICGDNFGCGSSREYAVWGLLQLGIRAIIAPSISGIFFGNCEKNGLLAITVPQADVDPLVAHASLPETSEMQIDLHNQTILASSLCVPFEISDTRKQLLLSGADHIQTTLNATDQIRAFEKKQQSHAPWLWAHLAKG
ncbi:3-isopropylmalate dehydratase small subunit [Parasulfitobacter algicola]|uniref:3-isopropylmalate dehydratase small subunit n=1 Tax=Parasulfitobacter algicola TaxID=2614809 RepID=A0ABX2IMK2_9RHOB|nr:3-isopropylmalate dehydratase small subunit [Sulfitobacter algicola]NSX53760.1 3-isopropylmalate dehydratase small subunit [Sulfitobacter algicola]